MPKKRGYKKDELEAEKNIAKSFPPKTRKKSFTETLTKKPKRKKK